MKLNALLRGIALIGVLVLGLTGISPLQAGDEYKIDSGHSYVMFSVLHFGVGNNYGRFDEFGGSINFDPAAPASATFQFEIKATSVNTGAEKRDKHLRSPDFFNAAQHPTITFTSSSVKQDGETLLVSGDLTLLGVTKPVTVKVKMTGSGKDPWGNFRQGFECTATVKRSDFGMKWGLDNGALSDEVNLLVALETIKG